MALVVVESEAGASELIPVLPALIAAARVLIKWTDLPIIVSRWSVWVFWLIWLSERLQNGPEWGPRGELSSDFIFRSTLTSVERIIVKVFFDAN